MTSLDSREAGLFEHVAKMSRLAPPESEKPAVIPVRFKTSVHPMAEVKTLTKPPSSPKDDDQKQLKKVTRPVSTPPVKIRTGPAPRPPTTESENSRRPKRTSSVEPSDSSPTHRGRHSAKSNGHKRSPHSPTSSVKSVESSSKERRNMRAAPRSSSAERQKPAEPQKSRQQELLDELLNQQEEQAKQKEAQQAAQQLINAAYLQQEAAVDQQKRHKEDAKQAKQLLDQAFPLAATRSMVAPSAKSVPTRQQSGVNTPKDLASVHTAPVGQNQRPKTALEKLLHEGSLTGLPQYSPKHPNKQINQSPRSVWGPTASTSSAAISEPLSNGHELHNGGISSSEAGTAPTSPKRSIPASLTKEDRDRLLQAIREELQVMMIPSGSR